ncbi:MAG: glutathione S-transferase family protein [Gammaproteobacteria bacterium]|nr:glutathione S-transferase family protein [Gammaproteobacteria bacterium]MDH5619024.1 glutathione S-transferase family protein [Gammaproteobacteria bacterium]
MKFYDCHTAPSPRRVRIFLAEKGLDIDTVQVDLGKGEQFVAEFRAVNPDCVVPVLQLDDGTCISEVSAICQYVEDLHPEPPLLGTSPVQRALVSMWNGKVEQLGLLAMMDAFRNSAKGLAGRALPGPEAYDQIPELAARGRKRVEHFFGRLNDQLATNTFLAGDAFSMADISAMVLVDFAGWVKIAIPDEATHLERWYTVVAKRPSASA